MSRRDDGTPCQGCGRPAQGTATINGVRYCHGETRPSCYEEAMWAKRLTMRPPQATAQGLLDFGDASLTATQPDLSVARQHAEAVAYGKLLGLRMALDALARERPRDNPSFYQPGYVTGYHEDGLIEQVGHIGGYDRAVAVVKRLQLGVEK